MSVAILLGGGGCANDRAVDGTEPAPTPDAAQVPEAVIEVLLRDNIAVDASGPALPDRSEPSANIIETDMFAFFEPETGKHLATGYIGPAQ